MIPTLNELRNMEPTDWWVNSEGFDKQPPKEKAANLFAVGDSITKFCMKAGMPQPKKPIHISVLKNHHRFRSAIEAGRIHLKSGSLSRLDLGTAHYSRDDLAGTLPCDDVIFATGYRLQFDFLDRSFTPSMSHVPGYISLYRDVMHPSEPSLFFIGQIISLANIVTFSEIQVQWMIGVLTGKVKLPSESERLKWCEENKTGDFSRNPEAPLMRHWCRCTREYLSDLGQNIPVDWPQDLPLQPAMLKLNQQERIQAAEIFRVHQAKL